MVRPTCISRGSIRQRGKSFELNVTVNGERIRRRFSTLEAAEVALAALREGTLQGSGADLGPTVATVSRAYLDDLDRRRMRGIGSARRTLRVVRRIFGEDRVVSTITDDCVAKYIRKREREGVRAITIAREIRQFRTALNKTDTPWPCKLIPPPVPSKRAKRLLPAELAAVIEKATPRLRPLLVTAAYTGMRNSELRWLTWGDVDLAGGTYAVTAKEPRFVPKNGQERVGLPLPRPALEALSVLWEATPSRFKGQRDFVFRRTERRRKSAPWERAALCRAVKQVFEAAGVTREGVVGLHALRRSWASELLDRGFAIPTIQELGGWATPDVLLRYYASSNADQRRRAAAALDNLLDGHAAAS